MLTLDTGDLQHESCTVKHLFKRNAALLTEEVAVQRPGLCAYRLDDSYGVDVVAMWKKTHVLAAEMEHWLAAPELQEQ